jgi:hypothetical protein
LQRYPIVHLDFSSVFSVLALIRSWTELDLVGLAILLLCMV